MREKEIKKETKKEAEKEVEKKVDKEAVTKNDQTSELLEKIQTLEKEKADIKDQMIRHQADLENFKKRLLREKEDAVLFANTKLITDLLEFLDNLDRTISAAKQGGDAKSICDGVEIIQNQLLSSLNKNWGLEKIESEGKEFDPAVHEAYMMEVDSKLKKETVLQEFQSGYKLHDRVIRPAKVKVGKPE